MRRQPRNQALRVSKVHDNSHRDRGGPGRETQNCPRFWARVASSRLKSVNSLRDRGGPGRETQNCRRFWTRVACSSLRLVADSGSVVADSGSLVADSDSVVADSGLLVADSRAWWLKPGFSVPL